MEAQKEEAVLFYQQTIQQAFRQVSDALIAYRKDQEFRQKQEERTQANRGATDIANTRYEGGVTSYLEVLYNEQELFNAELGLAQARQHHRPRVPAGVDVEGRGQALDGPEPGAQPVPADRAPDIGGGGRPRPPDGSNTAWSLLLA